MSNAIKDILKKEVQEILNNLERDYLVPEDPDAQQRMCDHAVKLKVNHFHWPNNKVVRKTAEEFKLKKRLIMVPNA